MSFYKPKIFEILADIKPSHKGEYQLSDAVALAFKKRLSVTYSIFGGEWIDAGTPDNLLRAGELMKSLLKRI